MRIGILMYSSKGNLRQRWLPDDVKMLVKAIQARGHEPFVFRSIKCQLLYGHGKMSLLYSRKKFPEIDVLIPRPTVLQDADLELVLNKQLMSMGIPLVNGYMPVLRAKNKIRMLQSLTHKGIPIPRTVILKRLEDMDDAVKRVGGFPVIIKTPHGSFGKGVAIVESRRSLLSSLDILWMDMINRNMIIQQYIAESNGRDIRAFVVGDRVVASMERQSAEGDFRSNLNGGGVGQPIELTSEEVQLSLDAARALKLEVAGVDLLRTRKGPLVMEVNANPGLEGITGVTQVDVPGAIVDLALSKINRSLNVGLQEFRAGVPLSQDVSVPALS